MKRVIQILAAVLVLTLLIGVLSVFAAEQPLFVILGDSIAAGDGLNDPDTECYGALVADADNFAYINDAIGGSTSADLIERLKDEAVAADVAKADIISVSIGGNDFLLNDFLGLIQDVAVNNDFTAVDAIVAQFSENLALIIETIHTQNPDALIVMQTLYNPQYTKNDPYNIVRNAFQQVVDRYNAALTDYLVKNPESYVIADVGAAMADDETLIQSDGIHPNAAGHTVIANTILKLLFDLGQGTATEITVTVAPDPEPPVILLPALLFLIYYIISYLSKL